MTREQALIIAKLVYADVSRTIEDWEEEGHNGELINCHWDECISVDDHLFRGHELRDIL
jgi:hypothetical protein